MENEARAWNESTAYLDIDNSIIACLILCIHFNQKDFQYLLKNLLGSLCVSMSINKLGIKIKLYLILLKIYCTFD